MAKLTTREKLYVQHRAGGMGKTAALRACGFKGKRPDVAAAKLERKQVVKTAIEAASQRQIEKLEVSQDAWMREVWDVATTKIAKKHIRASDKNKALELAGRALGAFKDTAGEREVIGPGLTIIIQQGAAAPQPANAIPVAPGVTLMPGPER